MKKLAALVLVFLTMIPLCGFYTGEGPYAWGRDSMVRVGEGRFDICRLWNGGKEGNYRYVVWDKGNPGDSLEDNILTYYDHKAAGKLYLVGDHDYTVIDYADTKTYEQRAEIEEFNSEDQEIFYDSKRFRTPDSRTLYSILEVPMIAVALILAIFLLRKGIRYIRKPR